MHAYETEPDLVTGPASNTEAGLRLVKKLTGVRALNLLDKAAQAEVRELLEERLG